MKKLLSLALLWSMLAPASLRPETSPTVGPTAEPTMAPTAAPTMVPTAGPAATALTPTAAVTPELPSEKTDVELPAVSGEIKDSGNEVQTPKGVPEAQPQSVKITPEKPGHFRWTNLFLGALGGGILGGSAGFLLFTGSKADGSIDYNSAAVVVPVSAVLGIVAGGGLSMLLGLTTPLPAVPPSMNSRLDGIGLAWEPAPYGQRLVLSTHF